MENIIHEVQNEKDKLDIDRIRYEAFGYDGFHCYSNILMFKNGNRLMGFLQMAFISTSPNKRKREAWINELAVIKPYRRQGIGSKLIKEAITVIRKKRYKVLFAGSYIRYRATPFYKKMGFKIIREVKEGCDSYRDFAFSLDSH